jgi:hypothetical protein
MRGHHRNQLYPPTDAQYEEGLAFCKNTTNVVRSMADALKDLPREHATFHKAARDFERIAEVAAAVVGRIDLVFNMSTPLSAQAFVASPEEPVQGSDGTEEVPSSDNTEAAPQASAPDLGQSAPAANKAPRGVSQWSWALVKGGAPYLWPAWNEDARMKRADALLDAKLSAAAHATTTVAATSSDGDNRATPLKTPNLLGESVSQSFSTSGAIYDPQNDAATAKLMSPSWRSSLAGQLERSDTGAVHLSNLDLADMKVRSVEPAVDYSRSVEGLMGDDHEDGIIQGIESDFDSAALRLAAKAQREVPAVRI